MATAGDKWLKMAMNMNCRGAYLQNHCRNYSPYHPKIKDNNHFIHRLTDSKGNPAPPKGISHLPFQPMTPFQPMKSPPPQHEQRHLVTSTSVTPRPPSSVPPTLVRPPQPVQKPHRKEPLSQAIQEEKPTREVDRDPALEGLCRPLYCKVCNVTLNSAQQAQAHYQGKNHNKKLKNYTATNHYPSPSRASHTADTPAPQPPPPPPVVPQPVRTSTPAPVYEFHGIWQCASLPVASSTVLCATLEPSKRRNFDSTWKANSTKAKFQSSATGVRWKTLAMHKSSFMDEHLSSKQPLVMLLFCRA
nr:PREDICTED: zinc finger matrin-type protein 3 isoform X2 [Latimeria chalumnae]|eukprot:XP_014341546.1 PREDICTED: zinc finger matrin-type protein 3 isoform X2 [Latimeria chalumnae]